MLKGLSNIILIKMRLVRKYKFIILILEFAFAFMFLASCSDAKTAGNSAETGSPELAGVLFLEKGALAKHAHLQCIPQEFDVFHDTVQDAFKTVSDKNGAYSFHSLTDGIYTLEAFHPETGERLLVQKLELIEGKTLFLDDTLHAPGSVKIYLDHSQENGVKGRAIVLGTSILRELRILDNYFVVDSLPSGLLHLVVYLDDSDSTVLYYDNLQIPSGTTLILNETLEKQPLVLQYPFSMLLPEGLDSSLVVGSSDIPLILRLDSHTINFDSLITLSGRWHVTRILTDGSRSKELPISLHRIDSVAKEVLLWVRIDSLNGNDFLEIVFDEKLEPTFAMDVFPTNRSYSAVWHFDDGPSTIEDSAEKQGHTAVGYNLKETEGVIGRALSFNGIDAYAVVDPSRIEDSVLGHSLNFSVSDDFSFSLWVKLEDIEKAQTLFSKGIHNYSLRFVPDSGFVFEMFSEPTMNADSSVEMAGYRTLCMGGNNLIEKGKWIFVAFTTRNEVQTLFVNDSIFTDLKKIEWNGERDEGIDFQMGRMFDATVGSEYLFGSLDELFISSGGRTQQWIYAIYFNQNPEILWPKASSVTLF